MFYEYMKFINSSGVFSTSALLLKADVYMNSMLANKTYKFQARFLLDFIKINANISNFRNSLMSDLGVDVNDDQSVSRFIDVIDKLKRDLWKILINIQC